MIASWYADGFAVLGCLHAPWLRPLPWSRLAIVALGPAQTRRWRGAASLGQPVFHGLGYEELALVGGGACEALSAGLRARL